MGPAGAALGTTLSQTLSVVVALAVITRQKTGLPLRRASFKPRRGHSGPHSESGGAGGPAGRLCAGVLHPHHHHRQQPGPQRCRGGRHCGKGHQLCFSGALVHAVHRVGPGRPERRRRQGPAGRPDPALRPWTLCVGFGLAVGVAVQFLAGEHRGRVRQHPRRGWKPAASTSGAISGTVCLRGSTSASAAISAPTASRASPFCTTRCPSCWCASQGRNSCPSCSGDAAAHGLRGGGWFLPVGDRVCDRLRLAAAAGKAGRRCCVGFHTILINRPLT